MIRKIWPLATTFLLPLTVHAGVLKEGYLMCETENSLNQGLQQALRSRTAPTIAGCTASDAHAEGRVLERGMLRSRVLLGSGNAQRVWWVHTDALAGSQRQGLAMTIGRNSVSTTAP